jgi:hypothetical protein
MTISSEVEEALQALSSLAPPSHVAQTLCTRMKYLMHEKSIALRSATNLVSEVDQRVVDRV